MDHFQNGLFSFSYFSDEPGTNTINPIGHYTTAVKITAIFNALFRQ